MRSGYIDFRSSTSNPLHYAGMTGILYSGTTYTNGTMQGYYVNFSTGVNTLANGIHNRVYSAFPVGLKENDNLTYKKNWMI